MRKLINLIQPQTGQPVKLRLGRNLTRIIKQGNPWVFADALRSLPSAAPGSQAILLDNRKGREIARGMYSPAGQLAFRVCTVEPGQKPNGHWAKTKMRQALKLRQTLFPTVSPPSIPPKGGELEGGSQFNSGLTTGFRLFNGEGDGLPGLVCDIYGDTAVLRLDGEGPANFWNAPGVAQWVAENLPVRVVYQRKSRRKGKGRSLPGEVLVGRLNDSVIPFVENGINFTADVVQGQKTGFFLDQRENRGRIRKLAVGKRVLNVFGYTGGFSVYAGLGRANHVTTVDLSKPAIEAAGHHWQLNDLPPDSHRGIAADAFAFLAQAYAAGDVWDLTIVDPPSFAPSKEAVLKGVKAYQQLIAAAARVTAANGILAAASCSSHIDMTMFLGICQEGVSLARRRAKTLGVFEQPADHPAPLALPEFRYLKFALLQLGE